MLNSDFPIRVLWIEDDAANHFGYIAAPVILDGRFDLVVASNATEGEHRIWNDGPFGVVIVDVRLPPGLDEGWKRLGKSVRDGEKPLLGLEILKRLFPNGEPPSDLPPYDWAHPNRFGLLTVENDSGRVRDCMERTRVAAFQPKTADQGERVLLDLIEGVLASRS